MPEQKLDVITNEKGYKNLNLKNKYKVENGKKILRLQGIDPDNFIIVQKTFPTGYEVNGKFGLSFSCKVKYAGEECSFFLNEKDHAQFSNAGGQDDMVKISVSKETFINPKNGMETVYDKLNFEKVED